MQMLTVGGGGADAGRRWRSPPAPRSSCLACHRFPPSAQMLYLGVELLYLGVELQSCVRPGGGCWSPPSGQEQPPNASIHHPQPFPDSHAITILIKCSLIWRYYQQHKKHWNYIDLPIWPEDQNCEHHFSAEIQAGGSKSLTRPIPPNGFTALIIWDLGKPKWFNVR